MSSTHPVDRGSVRNMYGFGLPLLALEVICEIELVAQMYVCSASFVLLTSQYCILKFFNQFTQSWWKRLLVLTEMQSIKALEFSGSQVLDWNNLSELWCPMEGHPFWFLRISIIHPVMPFFSGSPNNLHITNSFLSPLFRKCLRRPFSPHVTVLPPRNHKSDVHPLSSHPDRPTPKDTARSAYVTIIDNKSWARSNSVSWMDTTLLKIRMRYATNLPFIAKYARKGFYTCGGVETMEMFVRLLD